MKLHILAGLLALGLLAGLSAQGPKDRPPGPGKPDAQMQAVLDELAALGPKPLDKLTPEDARKQPGPGDAVKAILKKRGGKDPGPEPVGDVTNQAIPSPTGAIPIRVYKPKGDGPFPVLVYYHGGGWVIATIDTYDASCRALCNAAGCIVVSVEYRKAPEHPYPAAAEDAFAAYQWVVKNTAGMKGDATRIAVGGESAGGNLAAVTAQQARDKGASMPVYQLLVYPVTNNDFDTPSYRQYADARPLNKPMMKWFFAHYIGGRLAAPTPYAMPLSARDFSKLPPATVITAEIDPLRDDGKRYADALKAAGVKVEYVNYEGVTHEFFGLGAVVDKAKQAVAKAADGLKMGFKK